MRLQGNWAERWRESWQASFDGSVVTETGCRLAQARLLKGSSFEVAHHSTCP